MFRPFLINELEPQHLLHDRRKVYEVCTPLFNLSSGAFLILWPNENGKYINTHASVFLGA